jgi:hypothetical protein
VLSAFALGPVQRLDERGDAQEVRKQDELLAGAVACLADDGEELDHSFPFLHRGFDVPHESWRWRVRVFRICRSRWFLVSRKLSAAASVAVSTVRSLRLPTFRRCPGRRDGR